ncbi:MAG: InlB B-repeat-containing protein [Treponema sp.]|jgi:uncharacterized repeat protein (TIGR02543 family)|nr:InlB B-repeat-containing protein [Treponema sp.]
MSNIYEKRRFSFGLLVVFATLAFIFTGCTDEGSDPEPTKYTVTFNVDGGSAVSAQSVELGKTVTKPANPTKAGHTFANWYKDEAKTTLWNFDTDVVVQNTIIYAKWVSGENVQSYKVTFNTDGGTPIQAEQTVVSGELVAEPPKPTKAGHTFANWYRDAAKTTLWNFATDVVVADTIIYAKWVQEENAQSYKVTFDADGGTPVPAEQTVVAGEKAQEPEKPTKEGYTFANWYRDAAKTTQWNFATDVVVQNTTIYAKWVSGDNVQSYTVTFNTDGGSTAPAEQDVVSGEPVAKPADPTKEGYIFSGWYNGQTPWDFSTGITQAITLTAHWTEAFTVTFNTDGGSAIAPLTVAKGEKVYPSSYQPTKSGNVFDGWYTDEELTTPAVGNNLTVNASLTLYAKWTPTSELADYVGIWQGNNGAYIPLLFIKIHGLQAR